MKLKIDKHRTAQKVRLDDHRTT